MKNIKSVSLASLLMSLSAMAHPGHSQHVHVTESITLDLIASSVAVVLIAGLSLMYKNKKEKA